MVLHHLTSHSINFNYEYRILCVICMTENNSIEKLTADYQRVEEQLQALSMQMEQFKAQKDELARAKEQIEKSNGKIFSSIGGALIESTKEDATNDIKEKEELSEMRLTMLKKQIEELKKREQELREKVTSMVKGHGADGQ